MSAKHTSSTDNPVPHGPRLRYLLLTLLLMAGACAAGVVWHNELRDIYDRVGKASADTPAPPAGPRQMGTCGMHPSVVLPMPGVCPICGMALTPLDQAKFDRRVTIDPTVRQSIGVRTATVSAGRLTRTIRAIGVVDYDESRVRDVNLKIAGWVETLHASRTGETVAAGQPLLELYSPDLYTVQQEYVQAYRDSQATAGADAPAQPGAMEQALRSDLLGAARKRLELFDISADQVKALEKTGQASKTMTIRSPYDGQIIAKNVVEGARVEVGTQLFRIADLSRVWVIASVYDAPLQYLQVGQPAVVTLSYLPGQRFEGTIGYIYPYLNQDTRQVRLRIELANPRGLLKPGMYANVEIAATLPDDRVRVPREAVVDDGRRRVVFVDLGDGHFDPRSVEVGVDSSDEMVEITSGLSAGERIVVSGQFLLDSEARMRESLAKMADGEPAAAPSPATAQAATQPEPPGGVANTKCPIMLSPVSNPPPDLTRRYKGLTIGFCCGGCPDAWDKLSDVERDQKLAAIGVRLPPTTAPATAPEAEAGHMHSHHH